LIGALDPLAPAPWGPETATVVSIPPDNAMTPMPAANFRSNVFTVLPPLPLAH
jgi:hypothetical protein